MKKGVLLSVVLLVVVVVILMIPVYFYKNNQGCNGWCMQLGRGIAQKISLFKLNGTNISPYPNYMYESNKMQVNGERWRLLNVYGKVSSISDSGVEVLLNTGQKIVISAEKRLYQLAISDEYGIRVEYGSMYKGEWTRRLMKGDDLRISWESINVDWDGSSMVPEVLLEKDPFLVMMFNKGK